MAKILKYILFFGIGVLLLFLAFKNQNPSELISQLKNVNYTWVLLSMVFGFIAIISRGIRWVILLKNMNYKSSTLNSIYSVAIGYFTNLAIPRAGEVTRCTSLSEVEKIPFNKLFGTIILERTIDFLILTFLILFTFLIQFEEFFSFFNNLFETNSNEKSSIGWYLLSIFGLIFLLMWIFRSKLKKLSLYSKISNFLVGVFDGFKSIKGIENKWSFWGHTFLIWLMYYLMTYVCFFAIEDTKTLNCIDGLFIMVVGGLGMIAPVQGGIGAYHLVVKIGLIILGISPATGILFATIVHTCQTLMTLIVGSLSLLMLFIAKRKNILK